MAGDPRNPTVEEIAAKKWCFIDSDMNPHQCGGEEYRPCFWCGGIRAYRNPANKCGECGQCKRAWRPGQ